MDTKNIIKNIFKDIQDLEKLIRIIDKSEKLSQIDIDLSLSKVFFCQPRSSAL